MNNEYECIVCGIKSKNKYCSKKCWSKNYYIINKERITKRCEEWRKNNMDKRRITMARANDKFRKNNKERFNELMMNHYRKNKKSWNSRSYTRKVFNELYNDIIKKECSFCKSVKNLEIHHEIYPSNKMDIIKAIKDKKIFLLCRSCHGKITRLDKPKDILTNIY